MNHSLHSLDEFTVALLINYIAKYLMFTVENFGKYLSSKLGWTPIITTTLALNMTNQASFHSLKEFQQCDVNMWLKILLETESKTFGWVKYFWMTFNFPN